MFSTWFLIKTVLQGIYILCSVAFLLFPLKIYSLLLYGVYVCIVYVWTHTSQNISENPVWNQSFPSKLCKLHRLKSDLEAYMISNFIHWAMNNPTISFCKSIHFIYNFIFVLIATFQSSIQLLLYLSLENYIIRGWRDNSVVNRTCCLFKEVESVSQSSHPEWITTFYNFSFRATDILFSPMKVTHTQMQSHITMHKHKQLGKLK